MTYLGIGLSALATIAIAVAWWQPFRPTKSVAEQPPKEMLNNSPREIKFDDLAMRGPTTLDIKAIKSGDYPVNHYNYLPEWVISPRMQTDQLTTAFMKMLPESLQKEVVFISTDRLSQNPERSVEKISNAKKIVLVSNFTGFNDLDWDKYNDSKQKSAHREDKERLESAIKIAKRINPKIKIEIVASLGDTTNKDHSLLLRQKLQNEINEILEKNGLAKTILNFGGDESMAVAMAKEVVQRNKAQGNSMSVKVEIIGGEKQHKYDGRISTSNIVDQTVKKLGLTKTQDTATISAFVLTENSPQETQALFEKIMQLKTIGYQGKIVVSDLTQDNGSNWESLENNGSFVDFVRKLQANGVNTEDIIFSSWGTANNCLGMSLSQAVLENTSQNELNQIVNIESQLHDFIFLNRDNELQEMFNKQKLYFNVKSTQFRQGPWEKANLLKSKIILEEYVNKKFLKLYPNLHNQGLRVKLNIQFPRTFEIALQIVNREGKPLSNISPYLNPNYTQN